MFKRFASAISSLTAAGFLSVCFLASQPAAAGGPDEAFANLLNSAGTVSVTRPGNYSSQARNAYVAGGLDIRFPTRTSPSLISITPMNFDFGGCGSISAFFGGFSFISGEEIKQLIQNVAQNSVGVAIELVMTTLCGPCANVMRVMRDQAAKAAGLAINSCEMARDLMDRGGITSMLGGDSGERGDRMKDRCEAASTNWGGVADRIAAGQISNAVCGAASKINESLDRYVWEGIEQLKAGGSANKEEAARDPKTQEALCKHGLECNTVWTMLNQTRLKDNRAENIRSKVLLMNVIGTNVACGTNQECHTTATGHVITNEAKAHSLLGVTSYPATLGNVKSGQGEGSALGDDMQDVFTLLMCGTNWRDGSASPAIQAVLEAHCNVRKRDGSLLSSEEEIHLWACGSGLAGDIDAAYDQCLTLRKVPLSQSRLAGEGYLSKVAKLLNTGVEAVRYNKEAMPQEVINLIQVMPVPLYQAINAAAVYPDAGENLIAVMSTFVAQLLAYADVRDTIRAAERIDKSVSFDAKDLNRLYALLGGMRAVTKAQELQIGQAMTMQQQLMEQIRMVNLAMQREVLSEELLGTTIYGNSVNRAAQGTTGGE